MAYLLASITSALSAMIAPQLNDQVNRASVVLGLIPVEDGAGKSVDWDVFGGENNSRTWGDGEDVVALGDDDQEVAASIPWAIYGGPVSVGDLAASVTASIGEGHSPSAYRGLGNYLRQKIGSRITKSAEFINTHIFVGTGVSGGKPALFGLQAIASPTSTYAGLDPATYTWWKGLLNDNGGVLRDVTKDLVEAFLNSFMKKGDGGGPGRRPYVAVCGVDLWGKLKADVELDTQVTVASYTTIPGSAGQVTIPSGCSAFLIGGTWIVMDPDCPAGDMYAWVDGALTMHSLPFVEADGSPEMMKILKDMFGNVEIELKNFGVPDQIKNRGRIHPYVKFMGAKSLGKTVFVGCYIGLKCNMRNGVGRLADLK